jgi:glycosyltransferase involved in cell wall biosynthesis
MADAMQRALTDGSLRQRCREAAAEVAAQFSAKRMLDQTISAFEQAARQPERIQEVSLAR